MATLTTNKLIESGGPYINALLPTFKAIAEMNNPFIANAAAQVLLSYQETWGIESTVYANQPDFPVALSDTRLRDAYNTTLIKNMQQIITGTSKSASAAWLQYMKAVYLFFQMIDPITFFAVDKELQAKEGVPWQAGSPTICPPLENISYIQRLGVHTRPTVPGEGTGFDIIEKEAGDGSTSAETVVNFASRFWLDDDVCPKVGWLPIELLESHYFTLNTAADVIAVWYNAGAGIQPVIQGVTKYIEVDISTAMTLNDLKLATDAAIDADGDYATFNDRCCPPFECDCGLYASAYVAVAKETVAPAADGTGGLFTVDTDLKASDGSTVASNLVTNEDYMNAWNDILVPYEETLGRKIAYLLDLQYVNAANGSPCCDVIIVKGYGNYVGVPTGCSQQCSSTILIYSMAECRIDNLDPNAPGVLGGASAGIGRLNTSKIK